MDKLCPKLWVLNRADLNFCVCSTSPQKRLNTTQYNTTYCLCVEKFALNNSSELMSCVKVAVAVLGTLSITVFMVSVDVKQH